MIQTELFNVLILITQKFPIVPLLQLKNIYIFFNIKNMIYDENKPLINCTDYKKCEKWL